MAVSTSTEKLRRHQTDSKRVSAVNSRLNNDFGIKITGKGAAMFRNDAFEAKIADVQRKI